MTSTRADENVWEDDEASAGVGLASRDAEGGSGGLFDGDTGDASADARTIITYLVRNRILSGRDEPELWDLLLQHEQMVVRHFHNMFVDVSVNRALRVAFKQQLEPAGVRHWKVVRAVTLTLEASVLALYARERAAMAVPGETVIIKRADARAEMEPYWPAQVHNKAAKDKKLNAALDALSTQDLLVSVGDDRWEVSPAINVVLSAQAIARFTDLLTAPDSAHGPTFSIVRDENGKERGGETDANASGDDNADEDGEDA